MLFGLLTDVMLDKEKITAAKIWAADYPRVFHALTRLEELDELLEVYKIRKYVSYELAMISGFNYYTGIIFAGYTFGSGEAIVNGGRYDNLLQSFGKSAPSIGFAVVINQLMAALQRQNVRIPFENVTKWFIYSDSTVRMLSKMLRCSEPWRAGRTDAADRAEYQRSI